MAFLFGLTWDAKVLCLEGGGAMSKEEFSLIKILLGSIGLLIFSVELVRLFLGYPI